MSYLLDTHTLLWLRFNPNRLPSTHRQIIESPIIQKYISSISVWEISLKFGLGKLDLEGLMPEEFLQTAKDLGFSILTPLPEQFASFDRLPKVLKHKDPFDRMLVWQAIQDNLTLLSSDGKLPDYNIHGLLLA